MGSSIMNKCGSGDCESDEMQLYKALEAYAEDYALDAVAEGKHDATKPHKELKLIEKQFCDRMREEVISNRDEKEHLCHFLGECKKLFGKSGDKKHLCSSSHGEGEGEGEDE